MRANLASTNNLGYVTGGELGAGCWIQPSASSAVEEYDHWNSPWHTGKLPKSPSVPKISVHVAGTPPAWFMDIVNRLVTLSQLTDDWDSYGAEPIAVDALKSAFELVASTMSDDTPTPGIVPTPGGGIQFEWHTANIDLEVEIAPSGFLSVFYEDAQGEHDSIEIDLMQTPMHGVNPIPECLNSIKQRLAP